MRRAGLAAAVAAAVAAGLLALACAHPRSSAGGAAPAEPEKPRAFAWAISRPGSAAPPLVIAGSVHLGQPGQLVLPPSVESAFSAAQVLVVEVDAGKVPREHAQALLGQMGLYTPPDSLSEHLAPETRALLPGALARVGLAPPSVEPIRPWFLATMLGILELQKAGYAQDGGVDHDLLARARGEKQIVELESLEEQIGALAGMGDPQQDLLLREQLAEGPRTGASMAEAIDAWHRGDAAAVERLVFDRADDARYAPVYESLYFARNRRMAKAIGGFVDRPAPHFVVLGAGHLVGEKGIVAELARAGFTVRQLAGAPAGSALPATPAADPAPGSDQRE
jgi:uncharacterized protein YbaP (TraB family)